ncbi:PP2C family protein-serine/threonine phosphatase [Serinicoccus sediminis]|uniref:PP2C family protein-serine/threonine phosphatase n=1 Tax=Serinicoccus sediminis TaxID=2306021 RepID=UPI0010201F5D|nr:SpoIIE family protein phosphatase [Serinicoccus sediminis]
MTEDDRVGALQRLDVLDSPTEGRFDRVIRLAQQLFDVPVVAVNMVDARAQHTIAAVGMECDSVPRADSFCAHTVQQSSTFVVPDASLDPRFAHTALVAGDPHVRFYAGHPLHAPGGQAIGSLCLAGSRPREFSALEQRLLGDLASWVEEELVRSDERLEAEQVQRRLVPRRPLGLEGYDVAGGGAPARSVSGDFYDWHELPDGFQVVLADVMGKGLTAAILAAGLRAVLRGASRYNPLPIALQRVAASMTADLDETGSFVTMFAARLDPETGALEWVDAGHGLAVIIDATASTARQLNSEDLPIGAIDDDTWQSHHEVLAPGETLAVVSDGILDLFDEPWDAVETGRELSGVCATAQDLVDEILARAAHHVVSDDVTALVVRRNL